MHWIVWLSLAAVLWIICALCIAAYIRKTVDPSYSYPREILLLIDQAFNVFFLLGRVDETISARCHRLQGRYWGWRWLRRFVDWLFRRQSAEHCKESFDSEDQKLQLPPEYRGCEHTRGGENHEL